MNTELDYSFLETLFINPKLHAKFLNTLSFLEYTGARKIVKSQDAEDIDMEKLSHMAEEIRHALMFKRFSNKVSPNQLGYDEKGVFCFELSRSYIKKIDDFCLSLMDKELCYPAVSYVVEERATHLYSHYAQLLKPKGIPFSLTSLLHEEENHLREMKEKVLENLDEKTIHSLLDFEEELFSEFREALFVELNSMGEGLL